jgi:hypothetical protein
VGVACPINAYKSVTDIGIVTELGTHVPNTVRTGNMQELYNGAITGTFISLGLFLLGHMLKDMSLANL